MRVFYHGSARSWESELWEHRASLQAVGSVVTDAHLMPMPGRVYLTQDPYTAYEYLQMRQRWPNIHGAVLEVSLVAGADVLVDEDCVGQALSIAYALVTPDEWRRWPGGKGAYVKQSFVRGACGIGGGKGGGWAPDEVAMRSALMDEIRRFAEQHVTARDLAPMKNGRATVRVYAKLGKILSPLMGKGRLAQELIALGANVAAKPSGTKVLGGWTFNGLSKEPGSGWAPRAFAQATYITNARRKASGLPSVMLEDLQRYGGYRWKI